jgi:hypothetical protein
MITKYRYILENTSIETLDITTIPNGVPYDTIIISDEEIQEQQNAQIQSELIEKAKQQQIALAQKLALDAVVTQQQTLPDSDALTVQSVYPLWDANEKSYALGEKCQDFNNTNELKLYKCVQAHTSQSDWRPINVPALFTEVQPAGTIGVWVQPTGAQDAYQIDDLVHFPTINDPVYRSTSANNVWAPNVFGWVLN